MTTKESRRERQRAATELEIKTAARRQLVASGGTELSLRGIAREMGMTAPGLYRYFDNLGALTEAMCHDYLDEVSEHIRSAVDAAGRDPSVRLHAANRAFRAWAVQHPAEFALLFRSKGPGPVAFPGPRDNWAEDDSPHPRRFAGIFLELFAQLWREQPFELPDLSRLPSGLVAQLRRYGQALDVDIPDAALWVFANAWVRLYSVIALEVLGQLDFMLTDVEPYFEAEIQGFARTIGVEYVPPSS